MDVEPAGDGRKGKLPARAAKAGASNEAEMVAATQRVECSLLHSAPGHTDENSRSIGQGRAAPRPLPATAAAAAGPRTACRFWRTAGGCRRGNDCKFVHAADAGGGAPKEPKVEEAFDVGGGGSGRGERSGNGGGGGGGWSRPGRVDARGDVGVVLNSRGMENGVGVASAEGMMVEEDDDDASSSGGVEELINGMSKLLIPRQMGFGSSSRRGDPIV